MNLFLIRPCDEHMMKFGQNLFSFGIFVTKSYHAT